MAQVMSPPGSEFNYGSPCSARMQTLGTAHEVLQGLGLLCPLGTLLDMCHSPATLPQHRPCSRCPEALCTISLTLRPLHWPTARLGKFLLLALLPVPCQLALVL